METKIVIATHGDFAKGIYDSLEMIAGTQNQVELLCAYKDVAIDYADCIKQIVIRHNYQKEHLLVITDLLGGSVNNEFMKYIETYPFFLMTGLNLGLLLELCIYREEMNEQVLEEMVERSKEYVFFCNKSLLLEEECSDF